MVERRSMTVYVVTYPTPKEIKSLVSIQSDDVVIGVDQAIFYLYKQRITIDLAVGDFDSLKQQGLLHNIQTKKLPVKKDETDTFHAIQMAYDMNPEHVVLIGGNGGERIEHMIAHFMLFHHYPQLKMITEHSTIQAIDSKTKVTHQGFVNIFPYPEATVSLEGFEYPLTQYYMKPYDMLGISNQLSSNEGIIDVHQGRIMLILTHE